MTCFSVRWLRVGRFWKMWDWICGGTGELVVLSRAATFSPFFLTYTLYLIILSFCTHLFLVLFVKVMRYCICIFPVYYIAVRMTYHNNTRDFGSLKWFSIQCAHRAVFGPLTMKAEPLSVIISSWHLNSYALPYTHRPDGSLPTAETLWTKTLYFLRTSRQSDSNGWSCWFPIEFTAFSTCAGVFLKTHHFWPLVKKNPFTQPQQ